MHPNLTAKKFSKFSILPWDLRRLVYSQLVLEDRSALARVSKEAFDFFRTYRLTIEIALLYVTKIAETTTLLVQYEDLFVEKYVFPPYMESLLCKEVDDYDSCTCQLCINWEEEVATQIRIEKYGIDDVPVTPTDEITFRQYNWESMEQVFHTLQIVNIATCYVKTVPYVGFVDCLTPPFPLSPENGLIIFWHLKENFSEVPPLNILQWNRWLGSAPFVSFDTARGGAAVVSEEVFSLDTVRKTKNFQVHGKVTVSDSQLFPLRATCIILPLAEVSDEDTHNFFKKKLKAWIEDPTVEFEYRIPGKSFHAEKLMEASLRNLVRPNFQVYPNFYPCESSEDYSYKDGDVIRCLTMRNLQANTHLTVAAGRLLADGGEEDLDDFWP